MTPTRKLLLICVSRFGTSVATMVYAGSLPVLLSAWKMTAAQAGSIQSAYNISYAVSLLIASWLADRIGAKIVFVISVWSAAAAFLGFANRRTLLRNGIGSQRDRRDRPRRDVHAVDHAGGR